MRAILGTPPLSCRGCRCYTKHLRTRLFRGAFGWQAQNEMPLSLLAHQRANHVEVLLRGVRGCPLSPGAGGCARGGPSSAGGGYPPNLPLMGGAPLGAPPSHQFPSTHQPPGARPAASPQHASQLPVVGGVERVVLEEPVDRPPVVLQLGVFRVVRLVLILPHRAEHLPPPRR
eukprot:gene13503-biopygen20035